MADNVVNITVCGPLQFSCTLTGKCHVIAYYSCSKLYTICKKDMRIKEPMIYRNTFFRIHINSNNKFIY